MIVGWIGGGPKDGQKGGPEAKDSEQASGKNSHSVHLVSTVRALSAKLADDVDTEKRDYLRIGLASQINQASKSIVALHHTF